MSTGGFSPRSRNAFQAQSCQRDSPSGMSSIFFKSFFAWSLLPWRDAAKAEAKKAQGSFGPAEPVGLAISEICWRDWSAKNKALKSAAAAGFTPAFAAALLAPGFELHAKHASTMIPHPIT